MASGRPHGALVEKLYTNVQVAAGETVNRRFNVSGARSIVVIWKAASGTPTMTIGAYLHEKSARETTLSNLGLINVQKGATVAAGQSNTIAPDVAIYASASDVPVGIREIDVQAVNAAVDLDVILIVLY